jgi:FAD:protein FMN transferase
MRTRPSPSEPSRRSSSGSRESCPGSGRAPNSRVSTETGRSSLLATCSRSLEYPFGLGRRHDALVTAGYDRTFEQVKDAGGLTQATALAGGRVTLGEERTIELEPGFRLDFGGIGKGYAVDCACRLLGEWGPSLVNAGGDLAVRGRPTAGLWAIGVDTPDGTLSLGLECGALATSGRDRRRWKRGTTEQHHLIDPATGAPSQSDLVRVTVVGRTAVEAEIRAKALFLGGEQDAVVEASDLGVSAVLLTEDGRTILTGALA